MFLIIITITTVVVSAQDIAVFLYIITGIETVLVNNFFIYLLLIVIFSSLVYKFFEEPILKLRPNYKN